jgi:hypothetical protein
MRIAASPFPVRTASCCRPLRTASRTGSSRRCEECAPQRFGRAPSFFLASDCSPSVTRLRTGGTSPNSRTAIQNAAASSIDSSTSLGRSLCDLPPIVGKMELCERIEGRRGERRQPHQVVLVLLGEIPFQPVGGLDEPVVRTVGPDEGDGQPASERLVVIDLLAEVPPPRVGAQLLVGEPDREPPTASWAPAARRGLETS